MVGTVLLIIITFLVNQVLISYFKNKFPYLSTGLLNKLFAYHIFFYLVYFIYAYFYASDSKSYFAMATMAKSWFGLYGSDTTFIRFTAYPFIQTLGFSYEMIMFLFSWFGYLGFVFFYIFFKENVKTIITFRGYDLITLLLFLPNMHFWTSSLGKGSLIFLGIGMFAYAMKLPQKRLFALFLGSFIVYHIRPHMFLFLGAGAVMGYFTGKERVPFYQKALVYASFIGAMVLFSDKIFAMAGINLDEGGVLESFEDFAQTRASGLSDSGSGVDINNYPLPLKLFTFWFRPLFIDAPGALGFFVSAENLLYLVLAGKLFDKKVIAFLKSSSSLVKMSLTIFITSSIALSFVMSNLGLAMRQKSMVMYFLFFVVLAFLEYKKQLAAGSGNIDENNVPEKRLQKRLKLV